MGRPKYLLTPIQGENCYSKSHNESLLKQLSDLSCTICKIKFKKKSLFDEHMENHLKKVCQSFFKDPCSKSENRQSRKRLKNYCYVCRKSFDLDEYKLHIQVEHQFDLPKINNNSANNDIFSYESGFVLLSKRKIKKESISPSKKSSTAEKIKSYDVSLPDIKIEPIDKISDESDWAEHQITENKKSLQKNAVKIKVPKLECSICGMRCKGKKGLKIHMSAHKRSQDNSNDDDVTTSANKNNEDSKLDPSPKNSSINSSFNNNVNAPLLLSNNGAVNFSQNAQPNYILNVPQFQNQSNSHANIGNNSNNVLTFGNQVSSLMNSSNQPNTQFLQSVPNQKIDISENVPRFDCNSEKYLKWLKRFVSKCKMHDYPLTPELCKKVSFVAEELTYALGNPKSSLKHKANHFYFMSMYNILTEIMLNHLQYTLCGINK